MGNIPHYRENIKTLSQVASELKETTIFSGGIRDLGDIIREVQRHQRQTDGAIPKVAQNFRFEYMTKTFPGRTVSARFRAPRDLSEMKDKESAYVNEGDPCTLCHDTVKKNFPQLRAFLWTDFMIWPNPVPIFDDHITFARSEHRGQHLSRRSIENMLNFMLFAPQFRIFYNGPQVGASVGKHQHFQGLIDPLPVEGLDRSMAARAGHTSLGTIKNYPARVVVLEGKDQREVAKMVNAVNDQVRQFKEYKRGGVIDINALFVREGDYYRAFLFPRKLSKPVTLNSINAINGTPASVEMSGVMVTGNLKGFEELTADQIETGLDEISSQPQDVKTLVRQALGVDI